MIAFYQPLLDCFISTEDVPATARRVALLASSRLILYCCDIGTAKNSQWITNDKIESYELTFTGAKKIQFVESYELTFTGAKKFQFCDPLYYDFAIGDTHLVDEIVRKEKSNSNYHFLASKIKKLLDRLIHWTKFLNEIRRSEGGNFIHNNSLDTSLHSEYGDLCNLFVISCERVLYLENEITTIDKKFFQLLNEYPEYKKLYRQYGNNME